MYRNVGTGNSQAGESPKTKTTQHSQHGESLKSIKHLAVRHYTVNGLRTGSIYGETFKLQSRDLKKKILHPIG
jgi:hypothetical protein